MRFNQNTATYTLIAPQTVGTGPIYSYYFATGGTSGFFQVSGVQKAYDGSNQFFNTARVILQTGTQPAAHPTSIETIVLLATDTSGTGATTTTLATLGSTSATTGYAVYNTDINQIAVFDVNLENKGQYLALQITTDGGTGGLPISACIQFGDAANTPVIAAQSGATTSAAAGNLAGQLYKLIL